MSTDQKILSFEDLATLEWGNAIQDLGDGLLHHFVGMHPLRPDTYVFTWKGNFMCIDPNTIEFSNARFVRWALPKGGSEDGNHA